MQQCPHHLLTSQLEMFITFHILLYDFLGPCTKVVERAWGEAHEAYPCELEMKPPSNIFLEWNGVALLNSSCMAVALPTCLGEMTILLRIKDRPKSCIRQLFWFDFDPYLGSVAVEARLLKAKTEEVLV